MKARKGGGKGHALAVFSGNFWKLLYDTSACILLIVLLWQPQAPLKMADSITKEERRTDLG